MTGLLHKHNLWSSEWKYWRGMLWINISSDVILNGPFPFRSSSNRSPCAFCTFYPLLASTHNPQEELIRSASKTETLDLCQLPCPLYEIHRRITINLPASIKTFQKITEKLSNWQNVIFTYLIRQREINKILFWAFDFNILQD